MQSKRIHPNVGEYEMSVKMPGYIQMQDAAMSFSHRETTAFPGDRSSYDPNTSAHIYVSCQALLDPDDCYIQCNLTMPKLFVSQTTANTNNQDFILDQLGSSIVRRVLVRCQGRTLCDVQLFSEYLHIKMNHKPTAEDRQNGQPTYAFYSQQTSQNNNLAAFADDQSTPVVLSEANLHKQAFNILPYQPDITDSIQKYDYLIGQRFGEDIQRVSKYYLQQQNPTNTAAIFNITSNPRLMNDPSTFTILFKLSDLPCFSSKQYFPTFLLGSVLDIQLDFQDPSRCLHSIYYTADGDVVPGTGVGTSVNYKVNNLQLIAGLIYPSEDYKKMYIQQRVASGMAMYKCQYVEGSNINVTGQTGSIVIPTSAKRLCQSIHALRELGNQISATKRATVDLNSSYRGYKWFSPFGNIGFLSTRVLGVTYPQAQSSVIISEQALLEQTQEAMGELAFQDKNRFFFDSQWYVQNYKIDPDQPLVDVSGIDTSSSGQLYFIYSMNQNDPYSNAEFINFVVSEQILIFNMDGSILQLR